MRRIIDLMFMTHPVMRLVLAAATVLSAAAGASPKVMTWNVGGLPRRALVYAPASAANSKAPLVLAFHGFGDTNDNFQGVELEKAWPQAIVVYPQGLRVLRSGAAMAGWQTEKFGDEDRDLQFVDAMLASLRERDFPTAPFLRIFFGPSVPTFLRLSRR
ncbi:MAG: hypothetical protein ABSG41_18685 [Bryobacteraceae bacterium]